MKMFSATDAAVLIRRGLLLEYATLGWNVVGIAAVAARSVALAGFGLDSLIEIFASVVVVWELTGTGKGRERTALRLIGTAFVVLAVYVVAQTVFTLVSQTHASRSPLGIIWLAVTFLLMLGLAWGKEVTGRALGNAVLTTEAHVTRIDAALAGAVLVGLVVNALAGWWRADPLAGLVIVYYGVREGITAWRGEG